MSFEESLVFNASPTLASIKIANLYNFRFHSMDECKRTISRFNTMMNSKGIYIELLKNEGDFYLIYVYRKHKLSLTLSDAAVVDFLGTFGYSSRMGIDGCLDKLKKRLNETKEFPHEIGVFLGYPLKDVQSFIETKGKHYVLCGDWKVYHDEETARCQFCKYKHCRETYIRAYNAGRQFCDMLVGA